MKRTLTHGIVVVAVLGTPAFAQVERGTVGVIYYTQDKIIVAADSHAIGGVDGLPHDDRCKVIALDGKLVLVVAGLADYQSGGSNDPVSSWASNEEAHLAYKRLASFMQGDRITPDALANEWAIAMSEHFKSMSLYHRQMIVGLRDIGNGHLVSAMFGGFDQTGKLVLFGMTISLDPDNQTISRFIFPIVCPHSSYCSIGHTEIVTEYTDLTSERARYEARTWKLSASYRPDDLDILKTIRLVDLTIAFEKGNVVGGSVDALELRKDGTLRWFARKERCPAD